MTLIDAIPVIVGLPLALLAGAYAIYRAARLAAAIRRGRGQPYSPPCIPTRQNTITGTPARRMIARRFRPGPDWDQALEQAWQQVERRENVSL